MFDAGEIFQDLLTRDQASARDSPSLVRDPPVPVQGQQVVQGNAHAEDRFSPLPVTVRGHDDRQGANQMGSDFQEGGPFAARFPYANHVAMLEVSDAAVDHFQMIRGGGVGKILLLQESHLEPPAGRIPCRAGAEDPPADDDQIVFFSL